MKDVQIKKMDRTTATFIGNEAVKVLNDYFKSKGVVVTRSAGRYTDTDLTGKFSFSIAKDAANPTKVLTKEERDYDLFAKMHNLPARGSKFTSMHGEYIICGWRARSYKYPILAKHTISSKIFKFQVSSVVSKSKQ